VALLEPSDRGLDLCVEAKALGSAFEIAANAEAPAKREDSLRVVAGFEGGAILDRDPTPGPLDALVVSERSPEGSIGLVGSTELAKGLADPDFLDATEHLSHVGGSIPNVPTSSSTRGWPPTLEEAAGPEKERFRKCPLQLRDGVNADFERPGIGTIQQMADLRQTPLLAPESLAARTGQVPDEALPRVAQGVRRDPERTKSPFLVYPPQRLRVATANVAAEMTEPRFDRSPGIAWRRGRRRGYGEPRETPGRGDEADAANTDEACDRYQCQQGNQRTSEEQGQADGCSSSEMES